MTIPPGPFPICPICHSVVADLTKHRQWHRTLTNLEDTT